MKVFLSWSDIRSKQIAEALRSWLPKVLQSVKPWMSEEDIAAGAQWLTEVSNSLDTCGIGIICVTPENQHNPWLQFEAGALSKTLDQTCVCPLVFDMTLGQLSGPLTQFQANELTKSGILKVLNTLNRKIADPIDSSELEEILDVWWDRLHDKLLAIPQPTSAPESRTVNDQLDELLELSREQIRRENLRLERSLKADDKLEALISHLDKAQKYLQRDDKIEKDLPKRITNLLAGLSEGVMSPDDLNALNQMIPDLLNARVGMPSLQEMTLELRNLKVDQQKHVEQILNKEED